MGFISGYEDCEKCGNDIHGCKCFVDTGMNLTKEQREEFEKLARPLIKFLNDNCHPHTTIVIDTMRAELSEGVCAFTTEDYIKD